LICVRYKEHKPFTYFKKETKSGIVWYVRFWDSTAKRYAVTRSTGVFAGGKKQRRYEAEQTARKMLPSIRFKPTALEKPFIQHVADFWLPDSPYVRECALVKKKPLSVDYVIMNHENVRRHIEPFPAFQSITLRSLTPGIIRDWMTWAASNGRSGRSINTALQAMRIPVRYALAREELDRDPFRNIKDAPESMREKGILSLAEVSRIIAAPVTDPRTRLAVLLGLLCGLRRGEVRGLRWGDIADGIITVCSNYQDREGLKAPKCGSNRRVPVPGSVQSALDAVYALFGSPGLEEYVMAGPITSDKPLSTKYFQRALSGELCAIRILRDEQKQRNITFHGLRHTYITLRRLAGITDMEIQALAGHKSGAMMQRYSHPTQVLNFAATREKLEKVVEEKPAAER
jgi:integrase